MATRVVSGKAASGQVGSDEPAVAHPTTGPAWQVLRTLGRGRSGAVELRRDPDGRLLACKVFHASGLTKLVQWAFMGAPNPYMWSEDAVRCAALRREILAALVPHWLPGVAVAGAFGVAWNAEARAWEMATAFVDGRPAKLHHPRRFAGPDEADQLVREVMEPLQARLLEAGCDGLVWQAGLGNPVALNNFLWDIEHGRWVWIDLESGVPAVVPLSPAALFGFYIPRALHWGRPLFDDIDTARLRATVEADECRAALGDGHARVLEAIDALAHHQARWKALRRHEGSIGYRLGRGVIDEIQAEWYRTRPLRWYAREARGALVRAPGAVGRAAARVGRWLAAIPCGRIARGVGRFLTSQRFRSALARRHVSARIRAWQQRGQMSAADAAELRTHLAGEESSAYVCDFGVHLAVKPFVKTIQYTLFPALFAMGLVGEGTLALLLVFGGATIRVAYTTGRFVQSWLHGRERPWVALAVCGLPVLGNFAYPLQVVWSSRQRGDELARFILYDGFGLIGAHLPIWGGQDTRTEHVANRLPEHLFRRLGRD